MNGHHNVNGDHNVNGNHNHVNSTYTDNRVDNRDIFYFRGAGEVVHEEQA